MTQHASSLVIEFGVQTAFLAAALWIMLKLQKLHWNVLGVLGSAALASGLDMIPYVGHYISVSVLLLCITKLARPDSYIDVIFTVGVGYALMFCMNLLLVGSMMGDLKPMIPVKAQTKEEDAESRFDAMLADTNVATMETRTNKESAKRTEPSDSTTNASTVAEATNNAATVPVQPALTNEVRAPLSAKDIVSKYRLKSVSRGARETLAMISNGTKTETVGQNDSFQVDTAKGRVAVRCDEVSEQKVILNVEGEKVTLLPAY